MIRVMFDPDQVPAEWKKSAKSARDAVITAWENWVLNPPSNSSKSEKEKSSGEFDPDFDQEIWKTLRTWLADNLFLDKCAYCETVGIRATPHGEHFRPKGRVKYRKIDLAKLAKGMTQAQWRKVKLSTALTRQDWHPVAAERAKEVPHPGYFWLAYNCWNLLPACEYCNTGPRQARSVSSPE